MYFISTAVSAIFAIAHIEADGSIRRQEISHRMHTITIQRCRKIVCAEMAYHLRT